MPTLSPVTSSDRRRAKSTGDSSDSGAQEMTEKSISGADHGRIIVLPACLWAASHRA
jgi:hypothetical protein